MPRQAKSFGRKLDCADIASSRETRKGHNQIVTMADDPGSCAGSHVISAPDIGTPLSIGADWPSNPYELMFPLKR
jgi:hypothetical protein